MKPNWFFLLLCGTLLASCAVGPDFERPGVSGEAGYSTLDLPAGTSSSDVQGGDAQAYRMGLDIPGQWWNVFHSEVLNEYVSEALRHNPTLEQAQATLRQAREQVYVSRGDLYPSINGGANVTRSKNSLGEFGGSTTTSATGGSSSLNSSLGSSAGAAGTSGASPVPLLYTIYDATVNASYNVDLWGGTRRSIESEEAQQQYEEYELEAAYLSISSNVVTAAITEASLRAQIAAVESIVSEETDAMRILNAQFELGAVSKADVLTQQTTLAQAKSNLPPLRKQLEQTRDELMALLGRYPTQDEGSRFELAKLTLPKDLPVSLPSALVDQRPDIRAAEASLHSATAEVGVTTANLLPQLTLSASYGDEATSASSLFQPGSELFSLGAGLTQPIFRGGTLWHQRREAEAQLDAAVAQYKVTVIGAFQNVADSLRAIQNDADSLNADLEAAQSASESLRIARLQFDAGSLTYITLLTTEQQYLQTTVTLAQAQAQRYADTAALFQSLGGGWWNRSDIPNEDEADYRHRTQGDELP